MSYVLRYNTQQDSTQHNDIQQNAEHCYAEGQLLLASFNLSVTYHPFMVSVIMLSVVMLCVLVPYKKPT
jgi:hypothetical protein